MMFALVPFPRESAGTLGNVRATLFRFSRLEPRIEFLEEKPGTGYFDTTVLGAPASNGLRMVVGKRR